MTNQCLYSDGAPCWAELATPDLAGARRFYGALLGWSFDEPQPTLGDYMTCRVAGKSVAAMMPISAQQPMPTAWTVYFQSPDIVATQRRVVEAGGKVVMPHHDVMGLGSMMIASDPHGAGFGVWQPALHRGAELFGQPGAMTWSEVFTHDGPASDRFYAAVFEHATEALENEQGVDYALYSRDGRPVSGRVTMKGAGCAVPAHWTTYFAVADLAAALAKIGPLEGKVTHEPFDTPEGRIAFIADPYGAMFAIIQQTACG